MNWYALLGVAFFGGLLLFGLRTGSMPYSHSWSFHKDEDPGWFWGGAALHAFLVAFSFADFIGLVR